MRREFRGKICAYCSVRVSKSDDHIFAGKFFLEKDRRGLPKAPACKACNGVKSTLEHYLISVLPFGGRHGQAVENLKTGVPSRLAKNLKLTREISRSMQPAWLREGGGIYQRTSMMSFDAEKLEGLLKFIGRGLAWYHWGIYLERDGFVGVMFPTDFQSEVLPGLLRPENFPVRVSESIGNDTVRYEGMQAREPATLTVWKVMMYGGVVLGSDRHRDGEASAARSQWWIVTGPRELGERWDEMKGSIAESVGRKFGDN